MTFVKLDDGNYYVFRRRKGAGINAGNRGRVARNRAVSKQYFPIFSGTGLVVVLGAVIIPKELAGKRIRFKVEVIE